MLREVVTELVNDALFLEDGVMMMPLKETEIDSLIDEIIDLVNRECRK